MADATPEAVAERFAVSRESLDKLKAYAALLATWQVRINLIGKSTAEEIWTRHIADALQLIRFMPETIHSIADLGSGAGIPGLILAIARPIEAHLFESNLKKAAFLREAQRITGACAIVHVERIEECDAAQLRVGAVTARALAPLPKLLELAEPFLEQGAIGYFHKGQDVEAELTEATKSWRITVEKHPSMTDSRGTILVVKEARRVRRQ
jgi:16S rRNA (guanine527-N7)-methyltransferase